MTPRFDRAAAHRFHPEAGYSTVMLRTLSFTALALFSAAGSAAELRATSGRWSYDLSGTATNGPDTYDFQRDLELQTGSRRSVEIAWDTPEGAWPDLALGLQRIAASGDHEETETVLVLGVPVTEVTRTIMTAGDLKETHLTARYPWTWGSLRMAGGLTARHLEGHFRIEDSDNGQAEDSAYDELIPQLHLGARLPLGQAVTLLAQTDAVTYSGNSAVQWRAGAELRVFRRLLVEAGWQASRYTIELEDDRLDARLAGALVRLGLVF